MSFIARIKRMTGRRGRVGLVLGAGGARGFAHIGVLKVLDEVGIRLHCIAGSSAGALVGGLYAAGMRSLEIEALLSDLSIPKLAKLLLPTLGSGGMVDGRRVKRLIEPYVGGRFIENLVVPFACVATDLSTGERVVFKAGDLLESIRASISIPGLFTPVRIADRILVDGAVVDPLPINLAFEMGADCAIVVRVERQYFRDLSPAASACDVREDGTSECGLSEDITLESEGRVRSRNPLRWLGRALGGDAGEKAIAPAVLDVILSVLSIHDHQLSERSIAHAGRHLLVEPSLAGIEMLDFHKGRCAIEAGEEAMRARLSEIDVL